MRLSLTPFRDRRMKSRLLAPSGARLGEDEMALERDGFVVAVNVTAGPVWIDLSRTVMSPGARKSASRAIDAEGRLGWFVREFAEAPVTARGAFFTTDDPQEALRRPLEEEAPAASIGGWARAVSQRTQQSLAHLIGKGARE